MTKISEIFDLRRLTEMNMENMEIWIKLYIRLEEYKRKFVWKNNCIVRKT